MRTEHRIHLGHLSIHSRGIGAAVALLVHQVHHGMRNGRTPLRGVPMMSIDSGMV